MRAPGRLPVVRGEEDLVLRVDDEVLVVPHDVGHPGSDVSMNIQDTGSNVGIKGTGRSAIKRSNVRSALEREMGKGGRRDVAGQRRRAGENACAW